jgi:GNAT superfamily N-acetyltransferase
MVRASVAVVDGVTIRRVEPTDWELLRDLRIRSLRDAPQAFGQSVDEALHQSSAEWSHLARQSSSGDRRMWLIAMAGESAVGVVQGRRRSPADVMVFSMWVDPGWRRSGVGSALIDAVIEWARSWGANRAVLWVFAANEAAIRFYRRLGFAAESGTQDAGSGASYGAIAMSRVI